MAQNIPKTLVFDKTVKTDAEDLCKGSELNIGDESLSTFYSLNSILVHVYSDKLHFIRKPSLLELRWIRSPQLENVFAA